MIRFTKIFYDIMWHIERQIKNAEKYIFYLKLVVIQRFWLYVEWKIKVLWEIQLKSCWHTKNKGVISLLFTSIKMCDMSLWQLLQTKCWCEAINYSPHLSTCLPLQCNYNLPYVKEIVVPWRKNNSIDLTKWSQNEENKISDINKSILPFTFCFQC